MISQTLIDKKSHTVHFWNAKSKCPKEELEEVGNPKNILINDPDRDCQHASGVGK